VPAFCVALVVLAPNFLNAFFRSSAALLKALKWLY
jgi:hypothetical protein